MTDIEVNMADLARVHIFVSGLVQGVNFRYFTQQEARRLGLKGWVRNLSDGRVEAEAEGERAALEGLVGYCRRGPPAAHVERIEVSWEAFRGDLGSFSTRR